jgi:YjbE family integral membrane protein
MEFALDNPSFWVAVLQIIAIDILLGGDNAVVIALACRNLPPELRRKGIFWGVAGAIGLRVGLTAFAVTLLNVPYLKIVGAALLLWIGIKLILPENDDGAHEIKASSRLLGAIKTIIIADAVMSLDNVIAVAAAAKDSFALIVFGLLVSIPIIVWCSQLVLKLMGRFPWIIVIGGGLLGWIALAMAVHDVAVKDWVAANAAWLDWVGPPAGALLVMGIGKALAMRAGRHKGLVELTPHGKTGTGTEGT